MRKKEHMGVYTWVGMKPQSVSGPLWGPLVLSEAKLLQKPVESSASLWLAGVKTCRNRDTSHVTQQILKHKQRAGLSLRGEARANNRPVSTASRLAKRSTSAFSDPGGVSRFLPQWSGLCK